MKMTPSSAGRCPGSFFCCDLARSPRMAEAFRDPLMLHQGWHLPQGLYPISIRSSLEQVNS